MAKIIKIGNSQGIRIPKPIIALANLEDIELDFVVLDSGLLITPDRKARIGWKNNINQNELTADWEWLKNS
jgi:antitoxin MazE